MAHGGQRQRVYENNEYARELICIGYGYKESNQHRWGPGCRDIYALHYVLSGRGYVRVQGELYTLQKGDSFLIYPDEEYFYYPAEQSPWEYEWVDFRGNGVERLLELTGFTREKPVVQHMPGLHEHFRMLSSGEAKDRIIRQEQETARLHLLLTYYFRENLSLEEKNQKDYLQLAEEYIANYYWRSDLTVPEIARHLHIDRTHLFRLFKEGLGVPPQQYLTQVRLDKACRLLEDTGMSIQAVAASVGYEDALYFSKIFRKAQGITPSGYRNNCRNNPKSSQSKA